MVVDSIETIRGKGGKGARLSDSFIVLSSVKGTEGFHELIEFLMMSGVVVVVVLVVFVLML